MFTYQRKFQYPLMLNLQLFAKSATVNGQTFEIDDEPSGDNDSFDQDDDDALDEIEVDEQDGDGDHESESDLDGSDDDEGTDDTDEDSDESESHLDGDNDNDDGKEDSKAGKGDAKKDNSVAKAVIAERRRHQAQIAALKKEADLSKKLMKLAGIDDLEVLQQRLEAAEAQRIAQATGVTPEQAQAQLKQQRELDAQRSEIRKLKYGQEVATLKADPFFGDIEDYREEYEEIAERTGQTLEEVYMAKRGRVRMKEYEREVEQRTIANRQKKQKTKVDTTPSGEPVKKENHNLTPDQLAVAKAAVKMGTFKNVSEYAKYLKK